MDGSRDEAVRQRKVGDRASSLPRQQKADVRATSDDSEADAYIDGESDCGDSLGWLGCYALLWKAHAPGSQFVAYEYEFFRISQLTKDLPQGSDQVAAFIDPLLSPLPPRWRNWIVRGIFSIIMVSLFVLIVMMGPTWLMALVFVIQFWCFHEIITIGLAVYRLYSLPWFRALSWYFLLSSNYFFFGESLIDYWAILLRKDQFLHFLVAHHRLISFTLYCIGFVWFVLSLRKSYYMRQFSLFAWSHVTLLLIVSQSFLIIQNIFQGLVW
ncbi:unnamed protein product [Gongylonema pulchrum]|uniref:phosphatidate cytidylyltransferase n=1 Tax=Gongylonema pulchrum TaxID=637853 RepID=A0A183E237_9BILA|nr:unnamed protein product [Gongylonema pulchrum]